MTKRAVSLRPSEVATSEAREAWECGGAMGWRLDDNAVAILEERTAEAEAGEAGAGGAHAVA
jgi:hypothetical protein